MCIIAYKKANTAMPTKKVLKECFENNPDGAGFMYRDNINSPIIIDKGYLNFKGLWKALRYKVNDKMEVVIHFRLGTSGEENKENCHPFPVSRNYDKLISLDIKVNMALAHNGVLLKYAEKESLFSDTQHFIAKTFSHISIMGNWGSPIVKDYIKKVIGTDKIVIFKYNQETELIGLWNEDRDTNIHFSNYTYKYGRYGIDGYITYNDYGYHYKKERYISYKTKTCGDYALSLTKFKCPLCYKITYFNVQHKRFLCINCILFIDDDTTPLYELDNLALKESREIKEQIPYTNLAWMHDILF